MELVAINWDLYSLGKTIEDIATAQASKKKEMPTGGKNFSYLVCVLKQSLDGDAITSMVVCLS